MKKWYEDSVGLHLTRAARAHRARAQDLLGEIGLHPGQESVLQVLLADDGRSMTRLAVTLKVKPPTVTKMVARMAAQGLVRRVASRDDGRAAHVYLTDHGRTCALELKKRWKRLERTTLKGFSDKERKKLVKALKAMEAALSVTGAADAGPPAGAKPA